MIIQGVFSMSIIDNLKSLFKRDKDNEEKGMDDLKSEDTKVTSSNNLDKSVVSGTKTTEPMVKIKISSDDTEDMTFKKDVKTSETSDVEENEEIAPEIDDAEEKTEVLDELDILTDDSNEDDEVSEDENNTTETEDESIDESEEVVNDEKVENEVSKDNDKKRDNMTLLTDKELLTDANRDKEFTAEFIDAGIETVKHCFQCGTCGGSCPSGRRTPYKVRQIVRKCLLGLKEEVISDDALWMCTTCYTCQERCPRSVKIVEIIKKARNVAAHAGYMALAHKKTGLFVIKTGHGVPINDATKALRSKIGLSELPATTHSFPEALEEVQKICEITAFDELIGYDKATGDLKE